MKIYFDEELHKYFIPEKPDIKFTSVTKFIHQFEPEKDWEAIAEAYAKKNNLPKEEVQAKWKKENRRIIDRGNLYHKKKEEEDLQKEGTFGSITEGHYKVSYDLTTLQPGIYTELILFYFPGLLTGTADKIIINPDKTFHIRDYKNSKKIDFEGTAYFKKELGYKVKEMMMPPVSHLDNVNGIHYFLQLSLYAYILESYGYKFLSGTIEHVIFNDKDEVIEVKEYPVTYYKEEVQNMIRFHQLTNL